MNLKSRLYKIIFESDTKAGKLFDIFLLFFILGSVFISSIESVKNINEKYNDIINILEIFFTAIFTIEYALRIYSVDNKKKYIFSFFGVVDFLSIAPAWIAFFTIAGKYSHILRIIRLIRIFRILKLMRFVKEAEILAKALKASVYKITVFILSVGSFVVILGTLMYIIEGDEAGFTSIPRGIYWAIITLTTVGFGDIVPKTVAGQTIASVVMILGYGVIAIPTGIVTSETIKEYRKSGICESCGRDGHDQNAVYCKHCGSKLTKE